MKIGLIGQTNVGKSTLFNQLLGTFRAIVTDIPGTTRDIIEEPAEIEGVSCVLLDSPGLDSFDAEKPYIQSIIDSADILLFVVDGKQGMSSQDEEIAKMIRDTGRVDQTLLIVNKLDGGKVADQNYLGEWYGLGFPELVGTSARQGDGVVYLKRKILTLASQLGIESKDTEIQDILPLAIIGRPNMGKSTLLNALVGEEVSKVSEIPGTTLDYVTSQFNYRSKMIKLYDTAGIRKKGKTTGLERIAYEKTLAMVKYIQPMVVLLIDATQEMASRDKTLLGELHDLHIPLVVVVNKIDMLEPHETERYIKQLKRRYKMFEHVPMVGISAQDKINLPAMMTEITKLWKRYQVRISTPTLNKVLSQAWVTSPPRFPKNKICKWKYISQVGTTPPTFYLSVNNEKFVNFAFVRWIQNVLYKHFDLEGIPLKLVFGSKDVDNPYGRK